MIAAPFQRTFLLPLIAMCLSVGALAQENTPLVKVERVRLDALQRQLPLTGRVHSRHDASLSLTLAGELVSVLEPGTRVLAGEVIAELDKQPIMLRKAELQLLLEREQINVGYLEKELKRLHRLRKDNNASESLLDEGSSMRDLSLQDIRALQARIDQVDDELRRSRLVAPFPGIIAERFKRGGEYARPGDVIARLVDLGTLELRFAVPVVYLSRVQEGKRITFTSQRGQLMGEPEITREATVRSIIPAANENSQTFEVRADLQAGSPAGVTAGQLIHVSLPIASPGQTLQVPRDAIVLRAEGKYVFVIGDDAVAHRVAIKVGEGAADWVSVMGDLQPNQRVAIRGMERLEDGQQVELQGS